VIWTFTREMHEQIFIANSSRLRNPGNSTEKRSRHSGELYGKPNRGDSREQELTIGKDPFQVEVQRELKQLGSRLDKLHKGSDTGATVDWFYKRGNSLGPVTCDVAMAHTVQRDGQEVRSGKPGKSSAMEQRCKDTGRPWSLAPPLKKAKTPIVTDKSKSAKLRSYTSTTMDSECSEQIADARQIPGLPPPEVAGSGSSCTKSDVDFPVETTTTVKPRNTEEIRKLTESSRSHQVQGTTTVANISMDCADGVTVSGDTKDTLVHNKNQSHFKLNPKAKEFTPKQKVNLTKLFNDSLGMSMDKVDPK
jgi:hypothetical protein